jgi:hypothetical protein
VRSIAIAVLAVTLLGGACEARSLQSGAVGTAHYVSELGRPGAPALMPAERRRVAAVDAATRPADRPRLMFARVRRGNTVKLVLFFGSPLPGRPLGPMPFRVLGTCNTFFRQGALFAGPGGSDMCANWKPTPADIAVRGAR